MLKDYKYTSGSSLYLRTYAATVDQSIIESFILIPQLSPICKDFRDDESCQMLMSFSFSEACS